MRSVPRLSVFLVAVVSFCIPAVSAQTASDIVDVNKPVERELKGGEAHQYSVILNVGEFMHVKTEQKGIDVVVSLLAPDGTAIIDVDSPNGTKGEEPLWFIAETAGKYLIRVASLEKNASAGAYEITLTDLRPATAKDQEDTARSLGNQARSLFGRDTAKARALAERSLALAESCGCKLIKANELGLIGNTYALDRELTRALDYHNQALAIFRELKDPLEAFALNNLGIVYAYLGDSDRAVESFGEAAEIMSKAGKKRNAAVMLYNVGNMQRGRGDFGKAMAYYQRSSDLFKESGEGDMPPDLAINVAGVYKDQGQFEQAAAYYEKALAGFEKSRNNYGLKETLDGLGGLYFQTGDFRKSLEYYQHAAELQPKLSGKPDGELLSKIGETYVRLGDYSNAEQFYDRALKANEGSIPVMISYAKMCLVQGKYSEAIRSAEGARTIFESRTGQGSNYDVYNTLARAYLGAGDKDKAQLFFQVAVDNVESSRSNLTEDDTEATRFFANRIAPYLSLISLLHSNGRDDAAFQIAENAKSRTIVDAFVRAKVDNSGAMTADEKGRERALKNELVSLNLQLSKAQERTNPNSETLKALDESLRKKRLEFEDFRTRAYAAHPELAVQRGEMNPITAAEASSILKDARSAVLEYVVTDDGTLLFVLTKKGPAAFTQLKVYKIDINRVDLATKVEAFRSKIAAGELDFSGYARDMYEILIRPATDQLAGKTDLIIVPDDALWNMPFQALQSENGRYLLESSAIAYAPSLTALREMKKKHGGTKADGEFLGFGNPSVGTKTVESVEHVFMGEKLEPLPEAERLVNSLKQMYGGRAKVHTGASAREETAKAEAGKYRIVQFATHGILNDANPMYSHIVLSQKEDDLNEDGLLEAWEMKDLDLNADLVILSACDTARGRVSSGEGMIGMTWAMFIAGAPATIASQWKVESSSTTELMLEFHRQMLASRKLSKAEALRRASLKLLKSTKYKHPSYWAGFVLVGDGS